MLVLRGEDAVDKVHHTIGHIVHERTSGETIRDTFGDYITDDSARSFISSRRRWRPSIPRAVEADLKLWAEYSDSDGGILDQSHRISQRGRRSRRSLVLIKPDNFKFPNQRPGGVIEVFSRTGLYIVGFKVHRMSVAQAEEFYGPVLPCWRTNSGPDKGRNAWEDIVEFMAGGRPSATRGDQRNAPGSEKCIAHRLSGRGRGAKNPRSPRTDRSREGSPGSIRKEFGQTIMVNAAHASDSAENAKREMAIVQVDENNFKPLIESFYARS